MRVCVSVSLCVCVCACIRACVRVCVCVSHLRTYVLRIYNNVCMHILQKSNHELSQQLKEQLEEHNSLQVHASACIATSCMKLYACVIK